MMSNDSTASRVTRTEHVLACCAPVVYRRQSHGGSAHAQPRPIGERSLARDLTPGCSSYAGLLLMETPGFNSGGGGRLNGSPACHRSTQPSVRRCGWVKPPRVPSLYPGQLSRAGLHQYVRIASFGSIRGRPFDGVRYHNRGGAAGRGSGNCDWSETDSHQCGLRVQRHQGLARTRRQTSRHRSTSMVPRIAAPCSGLPSFLECSVAVMVVTSDKRCQPLASMHLEVDVGSPASATRTGPSIPPAWLAGSEGPGRLPVAMRPPDLASDAGLSALIASTTRHATAVG